MSESAFVYLPDDEDDDTLKFAGQPYTLLANSATEIVPFSRDTKTQMAAASKGKLMAPPGIPPAAVAAHFVSSHGQWGVCVVSGPVRTDGKKGKAGTPADQDTVDKAEALYLKNTREWAEELVLERAKRDKPREDSGLKPTPLTEDEEKAAAWLKKHEFIAS